MQLPEGEFPPVFRPHMDDRFLDTYAWYSDLSDNGAQELVSRHPVQYSAKHYHGYVDILPEDCDPSLALLLPQDDWGVQSAVTTEAMARMLNRPIRMVVLPNDADRREVSYILDSSERFDTLQGNFKPLAERHIQVMAELGINRFHCIGMGQAASLGAVTLREAATSTAGLSVCGSMLFEPSNVRPLGTTRLIGELAKLSDMDAINAALESSANDALLWGLNKGQFTFDIDSMMRSLAGHMRHQSQVIIGRTSQSSQITPVIADAMAETHPTVIPLTVPESSPSYFKNPLAGALLAKLALEGGFFRPTTAPH